MRIALVLLLLVPAVVAHGDEEHSGFLVVEAHDDDGWYFTIDGLPGKNPDIVLIPGETYSIVFTNRGSVQHDLHFSEAAGFSAPLTDSGETSQFEFTVPAEGLSAYWCRPHRSLGMEGVVVASEDEESPGVPMLPLLALLGLVAAVRRR